MVNETEGKYFTIGMYIAMREKSDNYWRISKVTINPNNSKEMSITLVANRMYKLEAIEWMEDQTDTTEAHKTDNSGICGPRIGYLD